MTDPKRELFKISDDFSAHMRLLDILRSTGEDTSGVEQVIAAYFTTDVTRERIDLVINYIRYCEVMAEAAYEEVDRCKELAESYGTQIVWLKDTAKRVLEASGEKRLEGFTAGSLTLRAAGGKAAVQITDASLLSEDLVQYEGRISGEAWESIRETLSCIRVIGGKRDITAWEYWSGREDVQLKRVPSLSRIAAELDKPCAKCSGKGLILEKLCPECEGNAKRRVAGAGFAERGASVIIR